MSLASDVSFLYNNLNFHERERPSTEFILNSWTPLTQTLEGNNNSLEMAVGRSIRKKMIEKADPWAGYSI